MLRYESLWDVTRFFDTAFALATLVGQAFQHGVLPAHAVYQCLGLLVRKLSIIEQVQAVHAIILHADGSLYDARALPLLMNAFKFRAMRVAEGRSVLWELYTQEHVGIYVAVSAIARDACGSLIDSSDPRRSKLRCTPGGKLALLAKSSAAALRPHRPHRLSLSTACMPWNRRMT